MESNIWWQSTKHPKRQHYFMTSNPRFYKEQCMDFPGINRASSRPFLGATIAPNLVLWVLKKIFPSETIKNDNCLGIVSKQNALFSDDAPQKNAPMLPMSRIGPDLIEKTYPDMSSFGRWGFKTNILNRKASFKRLFTSTLSGNYFEKWR